MKKVVFLLMALLLTTGFSMAQDQQRAIISAENAMHDFGVIKESAGKVTHVFVIKNDARIYEISGKTLVAEQKYFFAAVVFFKKINGNVR